MTTAAPYFQTKSQSKKTKSGKEFSRKEFNSKETHPLSTLHSLVDVKLAADNTSQNSTHHSFILTRGRQNHPSYPNDPNNAAQKNKSYSPAELNLKIKQNINYQKRNHQLSPTTLTRSIASNLKSSRPNHQPHNPSNLNNPSNPSNPLTFHNTLSSTPVVATHNQAKALNYPLKQPPANYQTASPAEKFSHPATTRTIPINNNNSSSNVLTAKQQGTSGTDTARLQTAAMLKAPAKISPPNYPKPITSHTRNESINRAPIKNLPSQHKIKFGAINSYVIQGIESIPVRVEVSIVTGLSKLEIIGLPDTAIKESKERVVKSIISNGYKVPPGNITINLSSAKIRKRGTLYDLPITLGILIASNQIYIPQNLDQFIIAGELSLEGNLKRIEGLFTTVLEHIDRGESYTYLIPHENEEDIKAIKKFKHVPFFSASTLTEAITTLEKQKQITNLAFTQPSYISKRNQHPDIQETAPKDFKEVTGHSIAKLALQLAAVNNLNVLFVGPPGSGKSMLMHRIPSILPNLSFKDSLMVNRIYKAYNDTGEHFITAKPFRTVHSTINQTSLIGGGRYPKPGEISLSHKGFLFLDELSEFERTTLQTLRTPLDMKTITISRVEQQVVFPCDFTLLACTNPCSCGYYGDPIKRCVCTRGAVSRFYSKLSGPLIDRFDIMIYVSKIDEKDFSEQQPLSSATMQTNINTALGRKQTFKPLYQTATLKEIFKTNDLARTVIQKALTKEIISIRRINAIFKIAYALELFYGRKMDKAIIMQALELARNKLGI
ncbi:hypothetical protein COTS27_01122 [Spirochaetota bacterium]|nr:hypothetical protein COTS27_01122 [Spirochaetota bacterium]